MRKKMATPSGTNPETKLVRKSGTSLQTFEDVSLFKKIPVLTEVTSVPEALALLGNDEKTLYKVITSGLQALAADKARNEESGWFEFDENGKETTTPFTGDLVSSDILNPVVLNLAKINSVPVLRNGATVEITWDEAKGPEEKRAVKDATLAYIKTQEKLIEGLKRKMSAALASNNV